jgi:hypothetical protein
VLINISLTVIDPRSISLDKLIRMRRNETPSTAAIRVNYANNIQQYVRKIVEAKTDSDVKVIGEEFELEMKRRLAELEDELKQKVRQTILSKELIITIAAASAHNIELIAKAPPVTAALVGFGALGKLWADYQYGRNRALLGSPLGYLYKSKQFPHY